MAEMGMRDNRLEQGAHLIVAGFELLRDLGDEIVFLVNQGPAEGKGEHGRAKSMGEFFAAGCEEILP